MQHASLHNRNQIYSKSSGITPFLLSNEFNFRLFKIWYVSHKSNQVSAFIFLFILLFFTEFSIYAQTFVSRTVRQLVCIMLFVDVGSLWLTSIGDNVRELARCSQPQGFGRHSEWWTEDDLWEHHMQSRWSSTNPLHFYVDCWGITAVPESFPPSL